MEPFEKVVADHGAVVWRVCRALLEPDDADDAWSETFLSALRAYPELRPDSNVRAWLVTIAHRKAIDQGRRIRRSPLPVDGIADSPAPDAFGDHDGDDLRRALGALPPKQRAAVVYHHVGGLPYAEVGPLIDSSEAAARRSAADGIATLRRTYRRGEQR